VKSDSLKQRDWSEFLKTRFLLHLLGASDNGLCRFADPFPKPVVCVDATALAADRLFIRYLRLN
jgi:hypothetical protein